MNGSVFFAPAVLVIFELSLFYRLHIFSRFGLYVQTLGALSSHYENHCISNSLCSKWVCRCVNWLFAYDTWFLFLLIVVTDASYLRSYTVYTNFSHCTHETMRSYCSVFGLIHIPFFQWFRLQYMLKCNAFYIWAAAAPDAAVVLLLLLHVVFSYFDERARDRFPFRPSLPFAFWRNIRMFGMMRCVHIYKHIHNWWYASEWETKFQLFALRDWRHILSMYN